ncbi:MAG: transcriptional regulator, partial [Clostridia bacterium]|nr:transcriptional regulator [Clostridia bacterium]
MIFFIVILIAIIVSGTTAAKKGEFFEDYCSPRNTGTINGIFSILIFLSHAVTYVKLDGVWDDPYFSMRKFLGQLIVVTYLFYSGYGIMESYKRKGTPYIKSMPLQRLFRTWYHFAIVVGMYAFVSIGI